MAIDYNRRKPRTNPATQSQDQTRLESADAPFRGTGEKHPASLPPTKPSQVPYREPAPTPAVPQASWDSDIHGLAQYNLDRVKAVVRDVVSLKFVELEPAIFGVGIAVGFGDNDFVVMAIAGGGSENQVSLSCGVLRDVRQDRLLVLHECNRLTQNNPAYPFYLHDAEIGWDVLTTVTFPLNLLLDTPKFLGGVLRGLPQVAAEGRTQLLSEEVGGLPYAWDRNDLQRLLLRSLL